MSEKQNLLTRRLPPWRSLRGSNIIWKNSAAWWRIQSRDLGSPDHAAVRNLQVSDERKGVEKLRGILREAGYQEGSEEDADL